MLSHRRASPGRQSGLSIVELLVGVAIGLVITAAAALLMSGQLVENRRLLTETQMQQDLRAAADIMAREVRRAGGLNEPGSLGTIWFPGTIQVIENQRAASLRLLSATSVEFDYYPGPFGTGFPLVAGLAKFSLQGARLTTDLGGYPQELTDANVMRVTGFTPSFSTDSSAAIILPCPNVCLDGTTACWPRFEVRRATIAVRAEALRDPSVQRAISSSVRLRNENVVFSSERVPLQMCPP